MNNKYLFNICFKTISVSTFLRLTFLLFTFLFLPLTNSSAQINYEPTSNSVYGFLERMSNKGLIQLNEEIKPFSRMYIAERIEEVRSQKSKVKSNIEQEELAFYEIEFANELKRLEVNVAEINANKKLIDLGSKNFGFDKYNRFRLFSYDSLGFGVFVDPIVKISSSKINGGSSWSYSNGIKLHGYLGKHVGFDLQFYDNHPRGDNLDYDRKFSPKTGYEFRIGKGKGFDFDRLNANLNLSLKYFTLSISKDFNYYGSGEDGNLILSDKAPSFPNLKLEVYPTSWLKFSYIHGFLNSQILDSSTFRYNFLRNHISTEEKYFVTHKLSITPYKYLNLSIGESIVYSDRFEPVYLIPIAFFRLADHYLTDPDENAGNAQIFASFWYKNFLWKTRIYGSVFVDELTTSRNDYPEAIGYNVGFKTIDPVIPESELVVEYSRINPFVYFHADSAQTYSSYGYEMGHWIGSNADEVYISFRKRFIRGLNLDLWFRSIRKGDEEDFEEERYQESQTFLWGTENFITMYGASINYELIHSFSINATYEYTNSKGGNDYLSHKGSTFQFSMSYGL